ncbi:serine O-acetyltransferase EpsC [Caldisericum exile]|uniref:serine O-acetyltransferase EpsC n=1 Tax=Caldisericum exile TaxID=693075 RepID=UPI003C752297
MDVKNLLLQILEDLRFYRENDPSVESPLEIIFTPSFRGLLNYRIYHALYNSGHKVLAKLLYIRTKLKYNMDIHPGAVLETPVMIDHGFDVVIGETAYVGKNTIIYHGVTLGARRVESGKRHPTIGRNCLIGNHASILGNITIGDFVKIGANSVVLEDIPPYSTVVGVKAKIVKVGANEKVA